MPDSQFTVSRFENRNGTISWRVAGWLSGVRLRKKFLSREEAAAEKAVLDAKVAQLSAGARTTATFLNDDQIRDAEAVFKVRMKRLVAIHPNLAAWLRAYLLEKYPLTPVNVTNTRRKVFARFGLTHDVLRHTFISMHVGKFRSMGEAALQAGNSEAIIRDRAPKAPCSR